MSTSELVQQLAIARMRNMLAESGTGAGYGGVLLGGLARKYHHKGTKIRRTREKNVYHKAGRKVNLWSEINHACPKSIIKKKYMKTTGLSGKKLTSARHHNKKAISKCIGHKVKKGTYGKGMLEMPFEVPEQQYPFRRMPPKQRPIFETMPMPRMYPKPMYKPQYEMTGLGSYSGGKCKSAKKHTTSPWVSYVKKYAKSHGIPYGEAMSRAGPSYRKLYG